MQLSHIPAPARLWVYTASRTLTPAEQETILGQLQVFFSQWQSHGRKVTAEAEIRANRFLLLSATLEGDISGCGIDSSVHAIEQIGGHLGVEWASGMDVAYRDALGNVRVVSRLEFKRLARDGAINPDTPVFDTTINSVGALAEHGFERPAAESWHKKWLR